MSSLDLIPASRSKRSLLVAGIVAVLLVFLVHGAAMVARSSFVIDGKRFFCLFDDAMISLTYARNWANGHGIVWNVGDEPVEGYTNFGWIALMASVHLLGLSPANVCLTMQILGLIVGCSYVVAAAHLASVLRLEWSAVVAGSMLVAAFYPLKFLSVMGMETGVLALLTTMAVASAVRCLEFRRSAFLAFLPLAIACLVRADMLLCLVVLALVLLYRLRSQRPRILLYAFFSILPLALQVLWRHGYYGEWLPNTYYAKIQGWPLYDRLLRGAYESTRSSVRLFPALCALVLGLRIGPGGAGLLVLSTYGILLAYQLWVGGDVWPLDRFVCPIVPALLVVAVGSASRLTALPHGSTWTPRAVRRAALFGFVAVVAALMNFGKWKEAALFAPLWDSDRNLENVTRALAIERASRPEAVVGLYYAGAAPYFVERKYVDFLGKSDKRIARMPARAMWGEFRNVLPGHNKWSWPYAIGERKPDFVTRNDGQFLLYSSDFQRNYQKCRLVDDPEERTTFWVRIDGRNVHRHRIELAKDWNPRRSVAVDDPSPATLRDLGQRVR